MSAWGPRGALAVILSEHQQLTTVTAGMRRVVRLLGGEHAPSPMVLRAMLYYIREYPELVHHPKEDQYLFARLRTRTSAWDDLLDELESQHAQGETRVRDLEHALTRYELKGASALPALRRLVEEYAEFYANHRRMEEEQILPAAVRTLTKEDWDAIDAAFGANRDPFEGVKLEEDLDKLFSMIVNTIPETGD